MAPPDKLNVPLAQNQIEAARRLHQKLKYWRASDTALLYLRDRLPGFDCDACLVKAVAINQLYWTNVFAIVPVSQHVHRVMAGVEIGERGIELVDQIASTEHKGRTIHRTAFAAKFCHFFVDEARFPIYDTAAKCALRLHLGAQYVDAKNDLYAAFCENLGLLCATAGIERHTRSVDRYLWIVGLWMEWKKWKGGKQDRPPQINAELKDLFDQPVLDKDLKKLLPAPLTA